jgi:hypothetical protein
MPLAVSGGTVTSGSRNRGDLQEGDFWIAPDTASSPDSHGTVRPEDHVGCAEFGLGDRFLAVFPDQPNECEATDFALGCGTVNRGLTVNVGPRRLSTCCFRAFSPGPPENARNPLTFPPLHLDLQNGPDPLALPHGRSCQFPRAKRRLARSRDAR